MNTLHGLVLKSTGSWYIVQTENQTIINCRVKGKFRTKGIKSTNPVTVGDRVTIELQEDGTGAISAIEPRKNYIIRRSINLSKQTHIIAANIDQAFLICSLVAPRTLTGFIDRFLVTAEAYSIPVVIVFNKSDLYREEPALKYLTDVYSEIGYPVIHTSTIDGEGLDKFSELLKDKTTLISGNSGVGKSTLINTIEPELKLKTSGISTAFLTGKHTTTFAEMFPLQQGGFIIDTPGLKSFGVIDIAKEELHHFFPEIFRLSTQCKFYNCVHVNETKCAVKDAVEQEMIAGFRYENYVKLFSGEELDTEY